MTEKPGHDLMLVLRAVRFEEMIFFNCKSCRVLSSPVLIFSLLNSPDDASLGVIGFSCSHLGHSTIDRPKLFGFHTTTFFRRNSANKVLLCLQADSNIVRSVMSKVPEI